MIRINGTAPPIEPVAGGYRITKSDLYSDATGRSAETGKMLAYPVRLGVYSIELEYLGCDSDIAAIEQLISGTSLQVTFRDNGQYITRTMYPSDREKETEIVLSGTARQRLTFSLIEY
ncbi:MAG: hypothetical protein IKP78_08760 [Ruminococcus sp.]|nr:hypothetical protein [Ruminococcus sp.]MBR6243837.1 hypothetical protein [Ruminococcus sp.]